ncbi:MAG: hypothetical protein GNW80_11375 [Asgard group archaeon]|nr:hypothetical protein [Asgard group archaeon]
MSTINEKIEKESAEPAESRIASTWKEASKFPTKRLLDYIGPTGLWILSFYLASIFMMIVLNIARLGFTGEAIFSAPSYFTQLFISYGLNSGKIAVPPPDTLLELPAYLDVDYGLQKIDFANALTSGAWLFAPLVIYVLGLLLAILPGSGFPQPIGDFDYLTNFQYFHNFVPFLGFTVNPETNIMTTTGAFYFLIAWLPIILACLIGAFVTKRIFKEKKNRSISVLKLMILNLVTGFIVGMQMGAITGEVNFRIIGALKTIFTSSYDNTGYFFSGQYHPNTIIIVSWFVNFIPMIMAAIWYLIYDPLEDYIVKTAKNTGAFTAKKFKKRFKKNNNSTE